METIGDPRLQKRGFDLEAYERLIQHPNLLTKAHKAINHDFSYPGIRARRVPVPQNVLPEPPLEPNEPDEAL